MKAGKEIGRFLIVLAVLFTCNKFALAQQDPMYTQYMDNLQVINPGFAGSSYFASVMMVARNQWVAFE
ncbi:MAG TPA: type IX secretion system membrane protein PorP/SprF, partial [Prolixibacteraceae bacterium]|nr:type IX secretion system membrane protein PorP/SprF [Prolixibacteraceae bacterium]